MSVLILLLKMSFGKQDFFPLSACFKDYNLYSNSVCVNKYLNICSGTQDKL